VSEQQPLPDLTYPALFTTADAVSRHGRKGHTRLIMIDLALLALAAIIGLIRPQLPDLPETWAGILAALLLAGALLAKMANQLRSYDAQWFDGRAVAETVKSASWRYAMHATPYDDADAAASSQFAETLRDTIAARPALSTVMHVVPADSQQITASMREIRALPFGERQVLYLAERVGDQIHWYGSRATENARKARHWFWIEFLSQGAALVVAILLIAAPSVPDFAAGLATVAAVATAWTQYNRHDELSRSYSLAVQELAFLRSAIDVAPDEAELRIAIATTEDAISREHTMWMARRG
jgi:hypothetical protein